MMKESLLQLGLNDEESDLYLALLELGGSHVSRLAKRAGKNRSTTYHTLNNLISKGLATKQQKGKFQYYLPEAPEKIVQRHKNLFDTATSVLPELLSIQNTLAAKPKIKFFQDSEGVETVLNDTLSAESEILGYTNLALMMELFPGYFRRYSKARMKNGIKVRYLSPRPPRGNAFVDELLPSSLDESLLEILFINPEQFPFENEIAIYGNKVALMSLSKNEQMALLIESETVAATMRAVFDLAWIGATSFVAR